MPAPAATVPGPTASGTTTAPPDQTGAPPDQTGAPPEPSASATTDPDPPMGSPAPAPTYDPNVKFEWRETQPSVGKCEGGTYVGEFQCDMSFLPGFPPSVFTGPLTFELTPSQDGEFLVIQDARFDATTNGIPFGADLTGELECSTGNFDASLDNGMYGTAPFTGTFFGTLSGDLDPLTGTLNGTWELTAGTQAAPTTSPCIGTWTTVIDASKTN